MFQLTHRIVLIGAVLLALGITGCNTAQRPEVETVGKLVSTTGGVYTQAVHATTDLTPAFVAPAPTQDDDGFKVQGGTAPELPEIAPKSGLTMGGAR